MLMTASISWNASNAIQNESTINTPYAHHSERVRTRRSATQISMEYNNVTFYHSKEHSIEETIAHAFHLASMTLLGIVVIEVSAYTRIGTDVVTKNNVKGIP